MGKASGIVPRWRRILPEAGDEAQQNDACPIMSAKRSVKSGHGDQGDRPRAEEGAKKK
jgi:hypothetical protein